VQSNAIWCVWNAFKSKIPWIHAFSLSCRSDACIFRTFRREFDRVAYGWVPIKAVASRWDWPVDGREGELENINNSVLLGAQSAGQRRMVIGLGHDRLHSIAGVVRSRMSLQDSSRQ